MLWVEVRERLESRLANSLWSVVCGGSAIVTAGVVAGNVITIVGVGDAVGALAILPRVAYFLF